MTVCFQIAPTDNVATVLTETAAGSLTLRGLRGERIIVAIEPIAAGHKVALQSISAGEAIVKYGVVIAQATMHIAPGQWVHLHNCRSLIDERSAHFDGQTGLPGDTPYV